MSYIKLRQQFEKFRREKGIDGMSREAIKWFMENTRALSGHASLNRTSKLGRITSQPIPGKFYAYMYDPKTKDEMPYWDTMPLILCTAVTEDGWYGINFHYMPPAIRMRIMEGFLEGLHANTTKRMKLRVNWKRAEYVASRVGASKSLNHSIKRYLANHVRSPIVDIDHQHWVMAVFLPLSRFKRNRLRSWS